MLEPGKEPKLEWAKTWLKETKKHFINGEWVSGEPSLESINPANGQVLAKLPNAERSLVDSAVTAAIKAYEGPWQTINRRQRAQYLQKIGEVICEHQRELATLESLDNGMLWSEALEGNLPDCYGIFDYYAGWIDKDTGETLPTDSGFLNFTKRQPIGVCGLIVPWNFPLLLGMWKLAPALAMGNTVIIKPSSATSLSMIRLMELLQEKVDLPPGTVNMLLGNGKCGALISEHMKIDKVSFTGSTAVGRKLVAASANSNLKRITLELGGKSPNIIFDDVDNLEAIIERSFNLTFSQKGEKCTEPTRLFIHKKHYDKVLQGMTERAQAVKCGDPFTKGSNQGPQCTKSHMESILKYIEIGKQEGAKLVCGGERDNLGQNANGYYIRPTIFADVDNQMTICQDEIFGPVLTVHPFESEQEVVTAANDSIYGLAAGLWTNNISRAHRVAEKLEAGMVFINRYGCYDFSSPFGGVKQSGWGKEMARQSLDAYTQTKNIWVKY